MNANAIFKMSKPSLQGGVSCCGPQYLWTIVIETLSPITEVCEWLSPMRCMCDN